MAAPLGLALALGLGLLALGMGSKKPSTPVGGEGGVLDPGMPPAIDAGIRQVLKTSTRPDELDVLAVAVEGRGYRNAAAALRARAAQLRGQVAVPGVPVPGSSSTFPIPGVPTPSVPGPHEPLIPIVPLPRKGETPPILPTPPSGWPTGPDTGPATIPISLPPIPPAPPQLPIEDIEPNIPAELAQSVAAILAKPDLSDQEIAMAEQLANVCEQRGFVRAAAKLRAKTLAIRGGRAATSLLQQIATIMNMPPGSLHPLPPQLPGVPPIGPPGIPGTAPTSPIPVVPPPTSPGTTPPVAPLAKTYKVLQGDNPSKIAQRFTGDSSITRVRELAAANPDKSARVLAGTVYVGETLTLPDAWPAKQQTPVATTPPVVTSPPPPSPIAAPHGTLRRGSSGPDVALWQTILGVAADGIFGPNTETATKAWQAKNGLAADGIVGPQTWSRALALMVPSVPTGIPVAVPPIIIPTSSVPRPPPPPSPPPRSTTPPIPPSSPSARPQLTLNSSGPDVALWQKIVGVAVDGKFGPKTQEATRIWQRSRGLTPDGIVGLKTWAAALGSTVAAGIDSYIVQPGDSPFKLARRFTGDGNRVLELATANPSKATRILQGLLENGEPLELPSTWSLGAAIAGAQTYEPDAAGVMDSIGGAHGYHPNGMGSHRYHG